MGKSSFVMHTEYITQINLLNREQRGDLLTAIMQYAVGGDLPEMDAITNMAFSIIRDRMDRDTEKYLKTVEARRESGRLGGRPPKEEILEEGKAKKANGFSENQMKAKKANGFLEKQKNPDNDYDLDNDNDKNINTLAEAKALFERLWKIYPNKKGKGQVSDTQKKRLLAIGEPTLVKAIERYSLELQKDADWRKPQNGSTFFNSGYIDYLDDNYVPGEQPKKQPETRFHNFRQRTYDYDEYERALLGMETEEVLP